MKAEPQQEEPRCRAPWKVQEGVKASAVDGSVRRRLDRRKRGGERGRRLTGASTAGTSGDKGPRRLGGQQWPCPERSGEVAGPQGGFGDLYQISLKAKHRTPAKGHKGGAGYEGLWRDKGYYLGAHSPGRYCF